MSAFELISGLAATFSITRLCRLLNVSSSGYYAFSKRDTSPRKRAELRLVTKMRAVQQVTDGVYGSRRMAAELNEDGERVGRRRVRRLMRQHGLCAQRKKRFVRPRTQSIACQLRLAEAELQGQRAKSCMGQ